MRVISQDGTIDMPYEVSSLNMVYEDVVNAAIYCYSSFSTIKMAEYSSEEKAKKAMEMLRIVYAGKFITNADIPEDFDETLKTAMKGGFGTVIVKDTCERVEFNNLNGYFQFPKEEELE
jgi:hypothetical protein